MRISTRNQKKNRVKVFSILTEATYRAQIQFLTH